MNEHMYLDFWGKRISIWAEEEEIKNSFFQLKHISGIPVEVKISPPYLGQVLENPTLNIFASTTPNLEFIENSQILNLTVNWQLVKNRTSSLNNIIGQLISLACANREEFPLHSSVVANDGKSYFNSWVQRSWKNQFVFSVM